MTFTNSLRTARSRRRSIARVVISIAPLFAVTSAQANAAEPPCRGRVMVAERAHYIGEQILHRVRLERDAATHGMRWTRPPRFPDFRVEALPGRAERLEAGRDGSERYVRERHRALFPARAGSLVIPASGLECRPKDAARPFTSALPAQTLEVQHPPLNGRPDDYAGLVGTLTLDVTTPRQSVTLGESIALRVVMRGNAALWDEPPPSIEQLRGAGGPRFDIYPSDAKIDFERGSSLGVRSTRTLTLVPREAGRLRVPALSVVSFVPAKQRYVVARSKPFEVDVIADADRADPTGRDAPIIGQRDDEGEARWPLWGFAIVGTALIALCGGAAFTCVRTRNRTLWIAIREAEAKAAAPERERAAALERALRALLEAHPIHGVDAESAGPPTSGAPGAIARLERFRFDRDSPKIDLDEIDRLLRSLARRPRVRR